MAYSEALDRPQDREEVKMTRREMEQEAKQLTAEVMERFPLLPASAARAVYAGVLLGWARGIECAQAIYANH